MGPEAKWPKVKPQPWKANIVVVVVFVAVVVIFVVTASI